MISDIKLVIPTFHEPINFLILSNLSNFIIGIQHVTREIL